MSTVSQPLDISVTLPLAFDAALQRVTTALQAEGFGVLTTIDVQATLKAKLNEDVAPYTILGACNPKLAHEALLIDPQVGLLLPCNVVVQATADGTRVAAIDPVVMLGAAQQPALAAIAREAQARMQRVIAALRTA